MKRGIDLSHWNNWQDIFKNETDFIIAKLTEGKTKVDYTAYYYALFADLLEVPFGVYHFAHPENNDVMDEVSNFMTNYKKFKEKAPALIALDIEAEALTLTNGDLDYWCFEWMQTIEKLTGAEVVLYCSQSVCKRFTNRLARNFGLWVARYRKEELGYGDVTPWNTARIWQYDSKGTDKNILYERS